MLKIRLNEQGKKLHPHLANEWLAVYGYNPFTCLFIIWDETIGEWVYISTNECEGRKHEAVE